MPLLRRLLNLTFTLGEGSFGESGANTIKVSQLRASAKILKAGGPSMGTAQLMIYGMTLDVMNKLSTLGMVPTLVRRNTVLVEAGDDVNGMGTVFLGTITNAYADFKGAPDVPFMVEAHTGLIESVATAQPTSFQGRTNVATAMSGFASKMQLSFENNGVDATLPASYFSGSYRDQMIACALAAGIQQVIDNGKLAIWKAGSSRGGQIPDINPQSGMIGYPSYSSIGIQLKSVFNPNVGFGGRIKVTSDLKPACGEWIVYRLEYSLDSLVPGGKWEATIDAAPPGYVVVS